MTGEHETVEHEMGDHEWAARLPAPRGDEPASLREDILDELADHLECAQRRERLSGGDCSESAVWNRVRERFGDPAAVALTLWRDALWRRIMMQRFLIGMCLFLALACVGAMTLSWIMMSRQHLLMLDLQGKNQRDIETQRRMIALLESRGQLREQVWKEELAESRRIEADARAQAERARDAEQRARQQAEQQPVSDWNPVEFLFVADTKEGPPLAGVKVRFTIKAQETGIPTLRGESGADGIVRFPRVRYGIYTLTVTAPSQETRVDSISVQPGEGLKQTVVCPTVPLENTAVKIRVAWPEELPVNRLACLIDASECRHIVDTQIWSARSNGRDPGRDARGGNFSGGFGAAPELLVSSDESENVWMRATGAGSMTGNSSRNPQADATVRANFHRTFPTRLMMHTQQEVQERLGTFVWPGTGFEFASIVVIAPFPEELAADPRYQTRPGQPELRSEIARWNPDQVRYRLQPAEGDTKTATLWIEPQPEAIEAVRTALAKYDEMAAELAPAPAVQPEQN